MAKRKQRSCSRCHAAPRWFDDLCVVCVGIVVGLRCAEPGCGHYRTMGHHFGVCTECRCPAFRQETAA